MFALYFFAYFALMDLCELVVVVVYNCALCICENFFREAANIYFYIYVVTYIFAKLRKTMFENLDVV